MRVSTRGAPTGTCLGVRRSVTVPLPQCCRNRQKRLEPTLRHRFGAGWEPESTPSGSESWMWAVALPGLPRLFGYPAYIARSESQTGMFDRRQRRQGGGSTGTERNTAEHQSTRLSLCSNGARKHGVARGRDRKETEERPMDRRSKELATGRAPHTEQSGRCPSQEGRRHGGESATVCGRQETREAKERRASRDRGRRRGGTGGEKNVCRHTARGKEQRRGRAAQGG
jgi:hypothetical protein